MLKLENVNKVFGHTMVLDHIDLHIAKSSIVGLAGPSGSGKSTLLRCIQKLESINSGSIHIEGNAKSGFMFQDFQLFPHMTVLENLIYAPKLKNPKIDHTVQARALLNNLGISHKANAYTASLSGGQKQRVALARSLMMHPEVLLCDEPTSGLDIATTQDVVALLSSVRDMGVTMVIASHDLDFLSKIADRIVLLKQGKIVVDIEPKQMENAAHYLQNYYA